jgi:hypothetical protein
MDDIDNYLETHEILLENVRDGLKSISHEEQQLLLLRTQLSKIKKIRAEQIQKDNIIASLREKLTIYEFERNTSLRQNSEIQELMSERIATLEQRLMEKESYEKSFFDKRDEFEAIKIERDILEKQLISEKQT